MNFIIGEWTDASSSDSTEDIDIIYHKLQHKKKTWINSKRTVSFSEWYKIDWEMSRNHNNKVIVDNTEFEKLCIGELKLLGGGKQKQSQQTAGHPGSRTKRTKNKKRGRDKLSSAPHPNEPPAKKQKLPPNSRLYFS